jgi:hypothetical protein
MTDNAHTPDGSIDSEDSSGNVLHGDWRTISGSDDSALQPRRKFSYDKATREKFLAYFNST